MIARSLALVIGLGFLLGASAARAADAKPPGKKVADVAGVWNSAWGRITLQTTSGKDGKTLTVRGSYDSSTGAKRKGLIKSGTFDPATGSLEFTLEESWWGNDTKGTAKLTLAADGQRFEGPYLKTNKDGGRDEGTVTLTHVRGDVAGIWESPWGIFTLRTAPADGNKRAVTGSYASNTGKNRTGLLEWGVFDPATGNLELALYAPWWGNQTKGRARLMLDAAGNRFKGTYKFTNQDGGKDEGEVSLLRLGGANFAAAIDSILADAGIKADTPGAAVMVIDHGKVIFSKCAGLARLTDKKAITRQTTFDLCSMGKQFTGAAILRLYEQGKLNLDDDIRKFIPEMPVYDANNPIRILHVARMTSGLPDGVMYAENVKSKNPDYLTNEDFAGEFARQRNKFPLKYPTGQQCEYSNTGYMVLALIVERASKQSYSAFMKKEFFEPLGMKTAWVNDTPRNAPSNPAYGYWREKDVFRFGTGPASITHSRLLPVGHGGVWASLDDMERCDAGWRQGKIIKPATQKLALVPSTYGDNIPNGYAFGWGVTVTKGRLQRMEHNGNFAGFLTFIERDVAEQRTLIVLCNSGSLDVAAVNRIFDAMPPKGQQK